MKEKVCMSIYNKLKFFFKWLITEPRYKAIILIIVIISLIVAFLTLWMPLKGQKPELILNDLSEKNLEFGIIQWKEDKKPGEISKLLEFKLANIGGKSASVKKIWVEILDFKDTIPYSFPPETKLPTEYNPYKIIISPEIEKYIVVGDGEHHFPSGNEEKFVIALNSAIPGYYTIRVFVEWYDQKKPKVVNRLSSDTHEVFLEGINLSAKENKQISTYEDLKKKLSSVKDTFEAVFFNDPNTKIDFVLSLLPKDVEIKILVPLTPYYYYYKQHKKEDEIRTILNINSIKMKPFVPLEKILYEFMLFDEEELVINFAESKVKKYKNEDVVKIYADIFRITWEQDFTSYFNLSENELIKKLNSRNVFVRRFALNELLKSKNHETINNILWCLTDWDFKIRMRAVMFLSNLKEIKAVGYLISMLDNENDFLLGSGGLSMYDHRISNIATIPILKFIKKESEREKNMREDTSSLAKFYALLAIGNVGDVRALPLLQSIISNPNEALKTEALEAIKKIKDRASKVEKYKYKHEDAFRDYNLRKKQIDTAKAYFTEGYDSLKNRKYMEAENLFRKAFLLDSRFPQVFEAISELYYEYAAFEINRDKINDAIDKCKASVKYDPRNYGAYVIWGDILYRLGRLNEAIDKFKIAISIEPDEYYAYLKVGNILFAQGKYEESIKKLKKVTELDGKHEEIVAYLLWTGALEKLDRSDETIVMCGIVSKKYPRVPLLYLIWGRVLIKLRRYSEAIEKLEKTIELNPDFTEAQELLICAIGMHAGKLSTDIQNILKKYKLEEK